MTAAQRNGGKKVAAKMETMRNNILRSLIIASLTLNISSGVVFAGPLEDRFAAFDRGDYATAVQLLRPLAENGNAQAQNSLGALYYNGKGVTKDFKDALKWYRLSAAQGNISAQVNLASMYYEGEGTAEDLVRAYMWLSLAATGGHTDAARMRDIVSKGMTAQQLTEARSLAAMCELSSYKKMRVSRLAALALVAMPVSRLAN